MGLEADYEQAARELVVGHLTTYGLHPRIGRTGVATGIGKVTIDFRIESVDVVNAAMQMVFWATIDGVPGLDPPQIELDLLGGGPDAHSALIDGVHVVLESVIPVLQADLDRRSLPDGVKTMQVTSMTDGVPATWDLFTGAPSILGDDREAVAAAVDDQALAQGIINSITDSLGERRAHWFKFFVIRTDTGELLGDMRVDGCAHRSRQELQFAEAAGRHRRSPPVRSLPAGRPKARGGRPRLPR